MKKIIGIAYLLSVLLFTSNAFGINYYISPNGQDTNPGTSPDVPWRSLTKVNTANFSPGDVVSFLRGSIWTGMLQVHNSGIQGKPILFTAYGTGERPIIRNSGTWSHSINIDANYIIVENFLMKDSQETGVLVSSNYSHNTVSDCEFTNMGAGVITKGNYTLITRNYVHDMVMVVNTPGGDDDFGANGFIISGPNTEVSYNRGVNLIAPSYDYGYDGGFVEFFGNADNSYVHHNWSQNANGFVEVGGKPGSARNIVISYNISVNNHGRFGSFHVSDQWPTVYENFKVENNTIFDISDYGSVSSLVIWFGGTPLNEKFVFQNNIVMLGRFTNFSNANITRNNNLYNFLDGSTKFVAGGGGLGSGEMKADPKFINATTYDFHLQPDSPAINKGIEIGYKIDYDNKPVPIGNAPDIGAYEYNPNGASVLHPSPPMNLKVNN